MNRAIIGLLLVFYLAMPVLILVDVIDFEYKFVVMVVFALVSYVLLRINGVKNKQLGITSDGWWDSIKIVLPITIIFIALALVFYSLGWSRFEPTETLEFYIFYVFISSPVQEFLYRGMTTYFGKTFNLPIWLTVIIAASLYSFVHIIYKDYVLVASTFMLGLIWHYLYLKTKNLAGVALSHAAVGLLTIFLGLI
ncbi:MAG: hypothetical protein CSA81_00450 [Acidobacteria bacterium]|nr:MAG: hypothetical protein CSA81_00450 [Acidobacteriota bacterium]